MMRGDVFHYPQELRELFLSHPISPKLFLPLAPATGLSDEPLIVTFRQKLKPSLKLATLVHRPSKRLSGYDPRSSLSQRHRSSKYSHSSYKISTSLYLLLTRTISKEFFGQSNRSEKSSDKRNSQVCS